VAPDGHPPAKEPAGQEHAGQETRNREHALFAGSARKPLPEALSKREEMGQMTRSHLYGSRYILYGDFLDDPVPVVLFLQE
jgi:hypothetical protein